MSRVPPKLLITAARMYYEELRTMESISRELGTSRSTVSRWLKQARELGHVQIRIQENVSAPAQLERQLAHRYGIRAVVAACPPRASDAEAFETTAALAARTVAAEVVPGTVLGIAWGTTMTAVARHLPPKKVLETAVVQLNGAGNTHSSGIAYASDILRSFSQAFGAVAEQFPVPTFFDRAETRSAMWRERSIERIRELQRRTTIAVFGIGAVDPSSPSQVYVGGYLAPEDVEALRSEGVAGDIATRFFRGDGTFEDIPLNARSSAIEFEDLRLVRKRICVVSSAHKAAGVRGALAAGLITDLVLDERAARALLEDAAL